MIYSVILLVAIPLAAVQLLRRHWKNALCAMLTAGLCLALMARDAVSHGARTHAIMARAYRERAEELEKRLDGHLARTSANEVNEPAAQSEKEPERPIPQELSRRYHDAAGQEHIYLVQEPHASIAENAPILIYVHGMGGKEEQGMEIFPSLRTLLNEEGWIYVCPRDDEYDGLLTELAQRYGKRRTFLSGASAGARSALREAFANASHYDGLILMCPAVRPSALATTLGENSLSMPTWIVCGENDTVCAASSRMLYKMQQAREHPVYYREIPGGDHNVPCREIRWKAAIEFVTADERGQP